MAIVILAFPFLFFVLTFGLVLWRAGEPCDCLQNTEAGDPVQSLYTASARDTLLQSTGEDPYGAIDAFLATSDVGVEGHVAEFPKRSACLAAYAEKGGDVMEIGFNAGHSALIWLQGNPDLNLTSFDLCSHSYTQPTAEYVSKLFPGRFSLVCGDSTETVPAFAEANPGRAFDVIHVDGGHFEDMPLKDIRASFALSKPSTSIIVDDSCYVNTEGWCGDTVDEAIKTVIDSGEATLHEDLPSASCNWGNTVLRMAD